MADPDIIGAFMSRTPEQQKALLGRMNPQQKQALYGEIQKRLAAQKPSSGPEHYGWETLKTDDLTTMSPHRVPHSAEETAIGVVRAFSNIGAGGLQVLLHPIDTVMGAYRQVQDAMPAYAMTPYGPIPVGNPNTVQASLDTAEQFTKHPLETAEGAIGQAGAAGLVAEVGGRITSTLRNTVRSAREGALRTVTKTGPRVAREVVEETAEHNADIGEKNAAAEQAARVQNTLNQNERTAKVDLGKLEKRVHDAANAKYEELKPKLYQFEANPETINNLVESTLGEMNESDSELPLLSKIRKASENGVLTYEDLDGFRSKLGGELRKGTLPGSTYHVYEALQDGITDEMTRIADEHGMADEANAARSGWRAWAEAFRDRTSPLRSVLKNPEAGGLLSKMAGRQTYLDRLRAFGPDGSALADRIASDLQESQRSKAKLSRYGKVEVPSPEAGPKKVLTPEELTQRKQDAARAHAERIYNSSSHLATVFVVLDSVRKLLTLNLGGAAIDVTSRVGYAAGKNAFANYLESPKVMDAIGKITAKDVEEVMTLPADQRAGFEDLILQAQAKGAKLRPGVAGALFGVSAPATQGPKTAHLKKLRESYAYTDASQQ